MKGRYFETLFFSALAALMLASVCGCSTYTQAGAAVEDASLSTAQSSRSNSPVKSQAAAEKVEPQIPSLPAALRTNDPYVAKQWALTRMPILPAVQQGTEPVTVALLDTGIDFQHEDLKGKIEKSQIFSDSPTYTDKNGHGTHLAGIIAAIADNGIGISGAAPQVSLLNVKVFDDNGWVVASNVADGINWAVDQGADVINMSFTTPSHSAVLEAAIRYAWSRGVVLVAAAGNHTDALTYPAVYPEVVAVSALNQDGTTWGKPGNAAFIDAYAPGASIFSTLPGDNYGYYSGSSMAAAYVSAAAALSFNAVADSNTDGLLNAEVVRLVRSLFAAP